MIYFCFFMAVTEYTLQHEKSVTEYTPSYYDQIVQPFSGCLQNPYALSSIYGGSLIAHIFLITLQS